MPDKHLVVLSGSGISRESGLLTFRESGGLWEGYDINEVASIEGWYRDPEKVLKFYDLRRKQAAKAMPNEAHLALARLEKEYDVSIITQNVDDLHERGGSSRVLHLHGELRKARSENDPDIEIDIGSRSIKLGDKAPDGSQLRPSVVWFGEMVPMLERAAEIIQTADIFVVIGTSLVVYPAAGLVHSCRPHITKFIVDPETPNIGDTKGWNHIQKNATDGVTILEKKLTQMKNHG